MRTEQKSNKKLRWFHRKPKQQEPTEFRQPLPVVAERIKAETPKPVEVVEVKRGRGRLKGSKNFTPDHPQVQRRLDLWRQGMPLEAIGQELGYSTTTIGATIEKFATEWDRGVRERNIARKVEAELFTPNPKRRQVAGGPQSWYVDAIDAWAAGSTLQGVAESFDVTRERIRQIVNEFATDEQRAEREQSLLAIRYLLDIQRQERNKAGAAEAERNKREAAERLQREAQRRDLELRAVLTSWCWAWRNAHPGEEGSIAAIMRWANETPPYRDHPRMQTAAAIYFALGRWGYEYPNEFLTYIGIPNNGQVERSDSTKAEVCLDAAHRFVLDGGTRSYQYDNWRRTQDPKPPTRAVLEKHLGERLSATLLRITAEINESVEG